jgi:hypothetical protein
MLEFLKRMKELLKTHLVNGMLIRPPPIWDMTTMSTKPIEIDKLPKLKLKKKLPKLNKWKMMHLLPMT